MSRCPLCKTAYPQGTALCEIDGTRLVSATTPRSPSTVAIPSLRARQQSADRGAAGNLHSAVAAAPAGKRQSPGRGASLASIEDDELTEAAQPEAWLPEPAVTSHLELRRAQELPRLRAKNAQPGPHRLSSLFPRG
ncbi:MAG: hypothetical protein GY811_28685, partial [Myxococcales bacterium]|nr:hypothetical protein [Myxococcales bacterium]